MASSSNGRSQPLSAPTRTPHGRTKFIEQKHAHIFIIRQFMWCPAFSPAAQHNFENFHHLSWLSPLSTWHDIMTSFDVVKVNFFGFAAQWVHQGVLHSCSSVAGDGHVRWFGENWQRSHFYVVQMEVYSPVLSPRICLSLVCVHLRAEALFLYLLRLPVGGWSNAPPRGAPWTDDQGRKLN